MTEMKDLLRIENGEKVKHTFSDQEYINRQSKLRAYMADPPKPPSIGGPAAMVLALLLAGTLIRGGPALPVESASVAPSAPALPQTPPQEPQTQTSAEPQDPRGMACFPPRSTRVSRGLQPVNRRTRTEDRRPRATRRRMVRFFG